ncbi:MAG: lipoate--protein ligase family protein [Candidatus Marinimicrobia bacterium]|nr:lipoate--protein ligase family protein [Candidatus Neomarinimicrobiota bacterium]MCF7829231.1 lipoate--protein ligase family protein [Candidatus Neomarinimicrobiota bacterium]MCF7881116.1 lipoate--protein ligase family protein [Candidatus Neomarinimicrobiota bacterium]
MAPPLWRFIPLSTESGQFHMAADTYLTHHSKELPVLRFYQWKPYALSLGHHQATDSIDFTACRNGGIDVVRRPTGGRAILHADELTYSVIIPAGSPIGRGGVHEIHNKISQALAAGILRLGADIRLNEAGSDLRSQYNDTIGSLACFSSTTKYELQLADKKVVGSAQRKFGSEVLQHGSILLGAAHRALPEFLNLTSEQEKAVRRQLDSKTTELRKHLSRDIDMAALCGHIRAGFQDVFGCEFREQPLTDSERQSIRDSSDKYRILPSYANASTNTR